MSEANLCIGIARSGQDVFAGEPDAKEKNAVMQCFLCGSYGLGSGFKLLQTKNGKKKVCPMCACVMDIEYLDKNNKKVKKVEADEDGVISENKKSEWNADLAWIPELSQRNINLLVLVYHITSWMFTKASNDKSKAIETASMREFLDILDARYMGIFKKRIDALKRREDARMAKIPEAQRKGDKAPQPIYNMDALAKVLKSMPMSEYEQRATLLSGLRIIPKDLSHIDKSFVESHNPVAEIANIYKRHHAEVGGLVPPAPGARSVAAQGVRGAM